MLRHAALRLRPTSSQGSLLRIATRRLTTLPKQFPRTTVRHLSSAPPPNDEEEKPPASAADRALAFASNLTVADAVRYATYGAGGFGVYMVSKGVLGTINTLLHLPPTVVAKYGFYSGFLTASAAAVAARQAWLAIHIRPEFVYRRRSR